MMSPYEVRRDDTGRTQAAGILAPLLNRLVERGMLEGEPALLANQMVTLTWARKTHLFEGDTGPRPHKVAVAAIALAVATRREAHRHNETLQYVYTLALSMLLDEIADGVDTYTLHDIDVRLLDAAAATLSSDPDDLQHEPLLDWYGL